MDVCVYLYLSLCEDHYINLTERGHFWKVKTFWPCLTIQRAVSGLRIFYGLFRFRSGVGI